MSKISHIAIIAGFLGILVLGCTEKPNPVKLSVIPGEAVMYESDSGDRIVATYYKLSDGSLNFVKVTMPDKKEYTLPQVMSASGVRYTDDRVLVWWTKGNTAFAEVRDENGQWKLKYNCKIIAGNK